MKQRILDFVKKNLLYFILLLIVAVVIFYGISRERAIIRLASELAKKDFMFDELQKDRDSYKAEAEKLKKGYDGIVKERDSVLAVKVVKEKELEYVKKKHRRQIDSLLNKNISNDTVYLRLQPIYPIPGYEPLLYPFSGSQIRQIYSTAVSYPRLQVEYELQSGLLNTYNDLNKKYQLSEKNLLKQVENLNNSLKTCDEQITIRSEQLKLKQKQLKRKKFWNWTYKGAVIVIGGYAILK